MENEEEAEDAIREEEAEDEQTKKRKQLGLPEFDPDAVPSSQLPKYMTLG